MQNNRSQREVRWRKGGICGASVALYEALLTRQNGRCAMCQQPPGKNRLALDHNHETGKIRGLLCCRCNLLVGQLEITLRDREFFNKAACYIQADGEPMIELATSDIQEYDFTLVRPYIDFRRKKAMQRFNELLLEPQDRVVAIKQVAYEFKLSPRTIRNYIRRSKVPSL